MKQVSNLVVLATFLLAASVTANDDSVNTSLSSVPNNSTAFVHVKVRELGATPGMLVFVKVFSQVKREADRLFRHHFGVKVSDLNDLTYVLPNFDSFQNAGGTDEIPGFVLLTFSKELNQESISRRLQKKWQVETTTSGNIYVDKNSSNSLTICSPNTIAFGSNQSVKWLLQNKHNDSQSPSLQAAMQVADSGHISFGVDGTKIPSELKLFLPREIKCFEDTTFAALNMDVSTGLQLRAKLGFLNKSSTDEALVHIRKGIGLGKALLAEQEWAAKQEFTQNLDDFESALSPLSTLGFFRYGQTLIDSIEIKQANQTVELACKIDELDQSLLIVSSLAAIQSIGMSANSKFDDIADDLSEYDAPETLGQQYSPEKATDAYPEGTDSKELKETYGEDGN